MAFPKAFTVNFVFGEHRRKLLFGVKARLRLCPVFSQPDGKETQKPFFLFNSQTVGCRLAFLNCAHA